MKTQCYVAVHTPGLSFPAYLTNSVYRELPCGLPLAGNGNVRPQKNERNVKGVPHMFFFSFSSIFLVSRFLNVIENSRESAGTAVALRHLIALCSQRPLSLFFFIVTCTYIRARFAREATTRNGVNRNGIATRCDKIGDRVAAASVSTARPICGAYTEASFHTSPKWKRSRRSQMNEHPERDVMSAQLLYMCVSSWIIKQ